MPLTAAEKQRRYRERRKLDADKYAENKRKDLERYHAKKRLVKDMTAREHRAVKKKWRLANAKRRSRRNALCAVMETPESSPGFSTSRLPSPVNDLNTRESNAPLRTVSPRFIGNRRLYTPQPSVSSAASYRSGNASHSSSLISQGKIRGRKTIQRNRSKLYRENEKLKKKIEEIRSKCEKYKKRYTRAKKNNEDKAKSSHNYGILSNAIKDRYKNIRSHKEKRAIQKIFEEKCLQNYRKKTQMIRDCLNVDTGYFRKHLHNSKTKPLHVLIQDFFTRDDVSRATAGKKETVTFKKVKMQKRYLLDNMKNLFQAFKQENPTIKCGYTTFTQKKPFYVKPPSVDARETCLCKLHTNILYMSTALYKQKIIPSHNLNDIIKEQVCNTDSISCMLGTCSECRSKKVKYDTSKDELLVKYSQWVRKSEIVEKSGKKFKVTKNIKEDTENKANILMKTFEQILKDFKRHVYNIKTQFRNYRSCLDGLTKEEIVLHIDFSENYNCKFSEEVQSHHFGGSRKQVSLHTGMIYQQGLEGKLERTPFCSVSENLSHNPEAIWAHLHPVLSEIRDKFPDVKVIHIFSDGPATQYRQKKNFQLICTKLFSDYGFQKVTWNFFEAGHGKGAADGIGGFLKRTADAYVAVGNDIANATAFYEILKDASRVQMHYITDEDIKRVQIPDDILPLIGTMKVHQVFTQEAGILKYRDLSCFCQRGFCFCLNPRDYRPLNNADEKMNIEQCESEALVDITNTLQHKRTSVYKIIYPSSSDSEDEVPLSALQQQSNALSEQAGTSKENENKLIEMESIHPSKIKQGVYVLVKVTSSMKKSYIYLGMALSEVEDDGEVKIVFLKSVDDTGKRFKLVENDVSYEPFDNLVTIVSEPKIERKGKRTYYQFDSPLDVFEK